uniref:NADH-ubiquinone oxidoreductase chain 2 n=1 Tax=Balmes birmanus TaxID=1708084 RepID=A0A1S5QYI2_9NEOP|nr:NADH dehydrogenase subunit 2 [Balmes birmanus]
MSKNLSNFLFTSTMIMGTLITISSNSWLGAWMGLEINLLSFIPLMMNLKNSISTESSLKYFLTQALASSILLFSVIMLALFSANLNNLNTNLLVNFILNFSILIKMGSAPFHFWFPEVMEGLSWNMGLILMTWQKIAPMILLSYCISFNIIFMIIFFSIMIGSIGGINQTSLRKLMAYSSINHVGWLLSSMLISHNYWMIYFSFYTFLSSSIIFLFNKLNIFYLSQTYSILNINPINKFMLFCNFLSLGGLPPFMGFFPKWMIIQALAYDNMFLITMMVIFTLITLFYYIRITYSAFLMNYTLNKWSFNTKIKFNMTFIMNFISTFGLILIFIIYNML